MSEDLMQARPDKSHWEAIYAQKSAGQLSWTQKVPKASLDFIHSFSLSRSARILDVGGGDSLLVDYLLAEGFKNITVLDISEAALKRAQNRLGSQAARVRWIVSDITNFSPDSQYDLWHDRATFHFLTTETGVSKYLQIARKNVRGFMVLATFSTAGPASCSGLPVKQYDETALTRALQTGFNKLKCRTENHVTPFATNQQFLYCSFKRSTASV